MIFAAGLGTRMAPLTDNLPKALIKVGEKTLLEILINKLILTGIKEIIINVHHFEKAIIDFLQAKDNFGIKIQISNESEKLLDTGGGIKKASWFFDNMEPFLVHNVDVISDISVDKLIEAHLKSNNLATLAVRKRSTSRYLWFDKAMQLCGWENTKTGESVRVKNNVENKLAFSGIHIIDPKIFPLMSEAGTFSIIQTYLRLSGDYPIGGFRHDESFWLDVGQPDKIKVAAKFLGYI